MSFRNKRLQLWQTSLSSTGNVVGRVCEGRQRPKAARSFAEPALHPEPAIHIPRGEQAGDDGTSLGLAVGRRIRGTVDTEQSRRPSFVDFLHEALQSLSLGKGRLVVIGSCLGALEPTCDRGAAPPVCGSDHFSTLKPPAKTSRMLGRVSRKALCWTTLSG